MHNFNHFGQGGAHYIAALHRIRELGAALHQAVSESSELRRSLANYENAAVNHRYTDFALRLNIDERDRALAKRDRALFESRQTVAGQVQLIGSLLNTNTALSTGASEHDRVVTELQRTIGKQGGVITELQHANANHVHTISEQGGTIVELQRTIGEQGGVITELQHANANHVHTISEQGGTIVELQRTNSKQGSAIADLQCANAEKEHIIVDLRHSNTEQEHTIAELQRTVAALQHRDADHVRANSEQGDTIANLQRIVAALQHRDSAHMRTINGLQRTVTDLQHANANHVRTIDELERANADQESQLNEAQCVSAICLGGINYLMNRFAESEYGTDIHRQSLDAAIPPPDILADDDDSDVTYMIVDIPTAADIVATASATSSVVASLVIDPLPGLHLPSFNLADSARQGALGAMYDQSGAEVTSERLLAVIDPFIFIDLDLLLVIYHSMYGRRLLSSDVSPLDFIQACTGRGTLRRWTPQLTEEHSVRLTHLDFIQRCDREPGDLTRSILRRLGLAHDTSAVVLSPVLCYTLVILCGTQMDRMTGQLLEQMFTAATRIKLQSLWIATEGGTNQMSEDDICLTVKSWVEDLSNFVALNGIDSSLDIATHYYNQYVSGSRAGGNASEGNVAARSNTNDGHYRWLLVGISADDLRKLYRVLIHVAESGTSPQIKDNLRRVSMELQHRTV
ncbi:hypothetical protein H4S07_003335 [Coemansia furcata]|uniref:Uncharacterized protein n=1 Tax=Coemansia furcata TaxID=417177 RepID=A0ACC1LI54_9FUNG|nr:hypothetical protein H4S07_003335 [Coemansia furcata]